MLYLQEYLPKEKLPSEEYMILKNTAYLNFASTDDLLKQLLDISALTLLPVFAVLLHFRSGLSDLVTYAIPVGLAFSAPKFFLVPVTVILTSALFVVRKSPMNNPDAKIEGSPGFIRCTRATLSFATSVCILSVDFPAIFPRSMAKTETYGLSLMDMGVGAVVFIGAINRRHLTASGDFRIFLVRTLPALALGLSRFVFVTEADYYVPTEEYGVHWNFFVTVWVVAVFGEIVKRLLTQIFRHAVIRDVALLVLGGILALIPSFIVTHYLSEWWFFFGDRTPTANFPAWLAANREGIVSSMGYVALDLIGSAAARTAKTGSLTFLIGASGLGFAVFAGLLELGEYPSRRIGNLSFCVAVIASVFMNLAAFRIAIGNSNRVPRFFIGILKQPLLYFLLSNAVVGLINMSLQTLLFPPSGALVVLTAFIIFLWLLGRSL